MDPELWELYERGSSDDEVSVIIRMAPGIAPPTTIRIVAHFGDVSTGRLRRGDIVPVRQTPGVLSLKAAGLVSPPPSFEADAALDIDIDPEIDAADEDDSDEATLPTAVLDPSVGDGRGVLVGVCDWGLDFTHANFRNDDGTTRLEVLWDQRGSGDPLAPPPYDIGRRLTRERINAALKDPDPPRALGYHPASGDPNNSGAHGTHVTDILCGNRREPGSQVGLATASDIAFVHLAAQQLDELGNLGDSVGLLEGLDFIRRQAAGRPCVLHLSAGKTGGPHRGDTLLERAVDAMLEQPGIVLVQSVGNYADAAMHTHARVGPDQQHTLNWVTPERDRTPNELEIWYSGHDVFDVTLVSPDGRDFTVPLDNRVQLRGGSTVWGNFYHRKHEPNSGMNHVVVYLYPAAPTGTWQVTLRGREVVDGRLHAWIERDAGSRYQSRFPRKDASSRYTTNTICNCFRAIAVGAYDSSQTQRPPTRFSSRGPTADGRQKPELAAPGFRILAARSMPRAGWRGERRLIRKSGTSMAAPHVSGTVALMMAAAGRPLSIHEIRRVLIGSVDPHPGPAGSTSTQLGYGYLNTAAAVAAARKLVAGDGTPQAKPDRMLTPFEVDDMTWLEPDNIIAPPQGAEDEADGGAESEREDCGCGRRRSDERAHEDAESAPAMVEASGEAVEPVEAWWEAEADEETPAFEEDDEGELAPLTFEDVHEAMEAVDEFER